MTPRSLAATAFIAALERLDGALVAAGFPPTSPWWRRENRRFLKSGKRRWVIRAGRRAGKSTTLCRLAVAWALWGTWSVPPGDTAVIAFVSVSRDESASRLRTIAAILDALGISYEQRGDEIELGGARRVLFRTFAATTKAVVGFTSIAIFCDEMARWESRDTGANPAREVVGSLTPTRATQPTAFDVFCSAPWGTDDYHAELFDQGDTKHQLTSFGATWECNPTISEEETHALEPDERTWSREYAAVPGATLSAAFDAADVKASFTGEPSGMRAIGFVSTDASSLVGGDVFAWIAGEQTTAEHVVVREIGGWAGEEQRQVTLDDIARALAAKAVEYGAAAVLGDQRESAGLKSSLAQHGGTTFTSYDWSISSKDGAVQLLRRLMRERRLFLPEHAQLKRELTQLKARLLPSGQTRYETNGKDYASCLVTLAHAMLAGDVRRLDPDRFRVGGLSKSTLARMRSRARSGWV